VTKSRPSNGDIHIIDLGPPNVSSNAQASLHLTRPGHPEGLDAVAWGLADMMLARMGLALSRAPRLAPTIDDGVTGLAFVIKAPVRTVSADAGTLISERKGRDEIPVPPRRRHSQQLDACHAAAGNVQPSRSEGLWRERAYGCSESADFSNRLRNASQRR
jgi:hypothetical protein